MKKISELWRDILPIFILALLAKGEVQSSRIFDIVEKYFPNIQRVNLYSTINTMIAEDLIEGTFNYIEDKGTKYYKITDNGIDIISKNKKELIVLSNALKTIIKSSY